MDWQRWLLCHISYTTTTFLQTQIPISTTNPKSVTAREGNIRKTKSFASFESYFCSLLVPMPVTVPTYITHNCVYVTCRQCLFITTIHIHVIFFFICSSPSRTFFFSFRSWPLFNGTILKLLYCNRKKRKEKETQKKKKREKNWRLVICWPADGTRQAHCFGLVFVLWSPSNQQSRPSLRFVGFFLRYFFNLSRKFHGSSCWYYWCYPFLFSFLFAG